MNNTENKNIITKILTPIFQYSNLLGLIGILIGVILYYLAEKKKELTFSIDSFISLIDKNSLKESRMKIYFDSVNVENLYKVNCSIINTGNSAILSSDIIDNIEIFFNENIKLLKYEVKNSPQNIKNDIKIDVNKIKLKTDLLNPNDRVYLSIYYTSTKSESLPKAQARIVDGNMITIDKSEEVNRANKFIIRLPSSIETFFLYMALIWNIFMFIAIFYSAFFQKENQKAKLYAKLIAMIITSMGAVLSILYFISHEYK